VNHDCLSSEIRSFSTPETIRAASFATMSPQRNADRCSNRTSVTRRPRVDWMMSDNSDPTSRRAEAGAQAASSANILARRSSVAVSRPKVSAQAGVASRASSDSDAAASGASARSATPITPLWLHG
jgi:hypothetical protein